VFLPYAAKFLINLIYIKLFGVERAPNPCQQFLMFRLLGVPYGLEEILVA